MAGLPWFELSVDFHDDPKVLALASRLREPLADSYISRVYAYCYKHAQDRFDASVASDTIEKAASWRGRRGVLFDALFAAEVLERDGAAVVVHGVKARLEPHLAKRVVDKQRQAEWRAKAAQKIGRPGNVTPIVTGNVTRDNPPPVTRESRRDTDSDSDSDSHGSDHPPARVGGERTKLGTLGSQLRSECEAGLGYGLTPCSQARADLLEAQIAAAGGVEAARSFVAATLRKRDTDLKSVGGLVEILEPFTPAEARQ